MPLTPNWTGAPFSLLTSYNAGDITTYQGSAWIANVSGAGNIPGQTSQWALFAAAGQNGINVWKGDWVSLTVYNTFDAVSYQNASYVSLVPINQGNIPSSSPTQWGVLAAAGGTGPAGAFTFLGVWSASTAYGIDNIVSYQGSSYVATAVPPIATVPTNATYWALIASVGAAGATGAQGVQ